jgi:protein SCO1/2
MGRALAPLALLALGLASACAGGRSAPNFTLQDDGAQQWQLSEQRGKAVLLFFGFTHCADTCPTTLAKLARVAASLGTRSGEVEIVLITVDPGRDSPAALHRFVRRFVVPGGAHIVGLTGTPSQLAGVEAAYHVWAARMPAHHGQYDVAHSAVVFFIDREGRLGELRDEDDSERALRAGMARLLA